MSDLIVDCKNQKFVRLQRAGPQGRADQVSFAGGPIYLFQSKKQILLKKIQSKKKNNRFRSFTKDVIFTNLFYCVMLSKIDMWGRCGSCGGSVRGGGALKFHGRHDFLKFFKICWPTLICIWFPTLISGMEYALK